MKEESAQEVFWNDKYKLSLKKAINLMEYLKENNIPYAYVNRAYYRLGNKVFDYQKLKEKYPDIEFAAAYSVDKDAICKKINGHK